MVDIAFDSWEDGDGSQGGGGNLSWLHTCSGSDRLLVVSVIYNTNSPVDTVKYNGDDLTLLAKTGYLGTFFVDLWYMIAPDTGEHTIAVDHSQNPGDLTGISASWTGVHQSVPFGTYNTANGADTDPSCAVNSASDEIVIDCTFMYQSPEEPTPADPSVIRAYRGIVEWDSGYNNGISEQDGAASVTMEWDSKPASYWSQVAVPVKPLAAAAGSRTWGHDTSVEEDFIANFTGLWTGTGSISGSGDSEILELDEGEYLESPTVEVGVGIQIIELDKYGTLADGSPTVEYKTGTDESDCNADTWHAFSLTFVSEGWAKIKLSRS